MTKKSKNHSKATRFFIRDRLQFTHLPLDRFCFALGCQIKLDDLLMKVNPESNKVSNLFHSTTKKKLTQKDLLISSWFLSNSI